MGEQQSVKETKIKERYLNRVNKAFASRIHHQICGTNKKLASVKRTLKNVLADKYQVLREQIYRHEIEGGRFDLQPL